MTLVRTRVARRLPGARGSHAWHRGTAAPRPTTTPGEPPIPPPSRVQGAQPPPGVQGGAPPVLRNVGGRSGGIAAQAKPNPLLKKGAGHNKTTPCCHRLLAKSEQIYYDAPRKWAASPLRFLEACRIREHWGVHSEPLRQRRSGSITGGANGSHQAGPGARRPGGMFPQPHNPSGKPGDRSERRGEANLLEPPAP